jgi:hypothetical protein
MEEIAKQLGRNQAVAIHGEVENRGISTLPRPTEFT